jgi:hypothetical protein
MAVLGEEVDERRADLIDAGHIAGSHEWGAAGRA